MPVYGMPKKFPTRASFASLRPDGLAGQEIRWFFSCACWATDRLPCYGSASSLFFARQFPDSGWEFPVIFRPLLARAA